MQDDILQYSNFMSYNTFFSLQFLWNIGCLRLGIFHGENFCDLASLMSPVVAGEKDVLNITTSFLSSRILLRMHRNHTKTRLANFFYYYMHVVRIEISYHPRKRLNYQILENFYTHSSALIFVIHELVY